VEAAHHRGHARGHLADGVAELTDLVARLIDAAPPQIARGDALRVLNQPSDAPGEADEEHHEDGEQHEGGDGDDQVGEPRHTVRRPAGGKAEHDLSEGLGRGGGFHLGLRGARIDRVVLAAHHLAREAVNAIFLLVGAAQRVQDVQDRFLTDPVGLIDRQTQEVVLWVEEDEVASFRIAAQHLLGHPVCAILIVQRQGSSQVPVLVEDAYQGVPALVHLEVEGPGDQRDECQAPEKGDADQDHQQNRDGLGGQAPGQNGGRQLRGGSLLHRSPSTSPEDRPPETRPL
jgi:hypothetical protein